jgi:hypothetical protein
MSYEKLIDSLLGYILKAASGADVAMNESKV